MNPIDRALGILLLLSGGKLVSATTLSDRFGVSLRTIYRDVERLIELGVPVEAERGAEGGYRLARGYHQPPVALTRRETAALLVALAFVRSLQTTPLAGDLQTAERKLVAALPGSAKDLLGRAERIIGIEPLPVDVFHASTEAAPAREWQAALDGFMDGILSGCRVRFDHQSPARGGELRPHEVEPYGVLFDRNLWYLAGRSVDADDLRLYRADRVRNLVVSGLRFRPPREFSVEALMGGAWLSRAMRRWAEEDGLAEIRVTAEQARRLSQDWYYRHALFTPDGTGRVRVRLAATSADRLYPLVRWLGPGAELIAPEHLRQGLADELAALADRHRDTSR
ncbi:helix-turn-helix transcriptional regulator [Pannonibacter tanglangensis]|uniref:WYL domain-containing protein n=1 Tax=Pannonibacter tanglangensis TaxID=2750084 RepID=A0ABW9ZJA2_9HYPH|nr:WYL domain-containing protein [Pannonibacter sp. XCT-34]NBN64962.1 WYL domain-containing protein [Pannonibacter sp. XCT-34]